MAEPTTTSYVGPERRRWNRRPPRKPWPAWALRLVAAGLFLCIMLPLGYIVVLSQRSDARATRAGRTICEQAVTLRSLADGFNRALDLLDSDTREVAQQGLAAPLDEATKLDKRTDVKCQVGSSSSTRR
jgi:hypothetical protein